MRPVVAKDVAVNDQKFIVEALARGEGPIAIFSSWGTLVGGTTRIEIAQLRLGDGAARPEYRLR